MLFHYTATGYLTVLLILGFANSACLPCQHGPYGDKPVTSLNYFKRSSPQKVDNLHIRADGTETGVDWQISVEAVVSVSMFITQIPASLSANHDIQERFLG